MVGDGKRSKHRAARHAAQSGRRAASEEAANRPIEPPRLPPPRKNKTLLAVSITLFSLWLLGILLLASCG